MKWPKTRRAWLAVVLAVVLTLSAGSAIAALVDPEPCDNDNPKLEYGGVRLNSPRTGTYYLSDAQETNPSTGFMPADFWIKIVYNADKSFDFESNYPITKVVVKGGPDGAYCYNYYDYNPNGVKADAGLMTPGGYDVSHVDFYFGEAVEELMVSKTAVTSYDRAHDWDIDKWVETEKGDTIGEENTPKIWLLEGYAESECATWYVDVDYEGYVDSDFNVSGAVKITNTGSADAVITSVSDVLLGAPAMVNFSVTFPYTLPAGETLIGTYSEAVAGKVDGMNDVTVTTEVDTYSASADVIWGDPDSETDKLITVEDVSDLFLTKELGMLYAPDYAVGEGEVFEYSKCFNWIDYEPGSYAYDNVATIVETGQWAAARLKVNVLEEDLTVSKTAVTSYDLTHKWLIDKRVETEKGDTIGEEKTPKIWLLEGYAESECATWYVDVDYDGAAESDFNVSGTVTVTNTGTQDAVITGYSDLLAGAPATVDFGVTFPYTLTVDETLEGTYSEDVTSKVMGTNDVTVTTELDDYSDSAAIIWGDPANEYYKTVNVKDVSDLAGEVALGSVTAPNGGSWSYKECFEWSDFKPGSYAYDNTATIIETGQSAEALLKINVLEEDLTVTKTAETSYDRTHKWDIDKRVETEYGYTKDGLPKIWLWSDGSGDECATWYVDVTYEGYEDSGFEVCGDVTIENTGTQDAVITSIEDLLGGAAITVDFGADFKLPYTLEVGKTLTGTYCEDGFVEGKNEITVTTEVDSYSADAAIVWGDPDMETNKTVNVKDVSDLFGEVALGSATAPNDASWNYSKCFAWTDYTAPGPYIYKNTATIIETGQYADATLKVNWDTYCWDDETAWAYGAPYAKPNWDFSGSTNWGWTNGPLVEGSYAWPIYSGAGGNDTSNGTEVGTLYVDYIGGVVTVKYELVAGNALGEVHLWVGSTPLPSKKTGKTIVYTDSPGQFPYKYTSFGFDKYAPNTWQTEWTWSGNKFKGDIYVAAHAVVWMQVQCPNLIP